MLSRNYLILISLLLIILTISSCKSNLPAPPKIDFIYEIDLDTPACARYIVKSQDPLVIVYDKDLPIYDCNGYVGVTPTDSQNLFNWINDIQRK